MDKYIVAGWLIDGSGSAIKRKVCLSIRDGMISAIDDSLDRLAEKDQKLVTDLSHCTLLPPLIDCNVNLYRSGALVETGKTKKSTRSSSAEISTRLLQHLYYCHSHGILGVGNSGGYDTIARQCAAQYDNEITITETVAVPAEKSKKNVVPANGKQAVEAALDTGCMAILQGAQMGEDNLKRMAQSQTVWIPNILPLTISLRKDTHTSPNTVNHIIKTQLDQLSQAREYGVKVALGTGAGARGILHGESVAKEMKFLLKAGYPITEAIKCTSGCGTELLGITEFGLLQPGMPATFLVSRGTPSQLPRKLTYLEAIYIRGVLSSVYRKNPVKTVIAT